MNTGKSQHTIPRFYLGQFLHPGRVYLRSTNHAKRVYSAKNVEVRDWYYSPPNGQQGLPFDNMNNVIENLAAPIYRQLLISEEPFSKEQRLDFAYFIANLVLRIPIVQEEARATMLPALEQVDKMIQRILKIAKSGGQFEPVEVGPRPSKRLSLKEWRETLESMREEKAKTMMDITMSIIPDLAPVIAKMSWMIMIAPANSFFITSDRPVVLTDLDGSPLGAGWAKSDAVGTLPLSPKRYLVLYGSPRGKWACYKISRQEVAGLNSRTISFAHNAIYSPEKYNPAEKWLQKGSRAKNEG